MFTDIIALNKARNKIIFHLFDPIMSNYSQTTTLRPAECEKITNVAVGRSADTMRLFITCLDGGQKTIIKMYDRNLNGELEEAKRRLEALSQEGQKIINQMVEENHMVFKAGSIKSLSF